ncbi:MAG: STAS domain-containing protein [Acidobacteriota bacterium]
MNIDVRQVDDVIVVEMQGRLIAGTGDVVLQQAMNVLVADDHRKILLDLSGVRRIDSAGIGELMASMKLAERFGCDVRLLNVTGQVLEILKLSQLLPLLNVYHDEDEALAAFAGQDAES